VHNDSRLSFDAYGRARREFFAFVRQCVGDLYPAEVLEDAIRIRVDAFTVILDRRFYADTLQRLSAKLFIKNHRVFVKYSDHGTRVTYPLERLVVARTEDYWSVKLKVGDWFDSAIARETAKARGKVPAPEVLDYRASNIIVERSSDVRAHGQWLTEEARRNHDKPNRMFQVGGKRVDQIFDANHISDSLVKGEDDQANSNRPKGYGPGQDETEEGGNLWTGTFVRHEDAEVKDASDRTVLFSED
jgi:hypothetical protein